MMLCQERAVSCIIPDQASGGRMEELSEEKAFISCINWSLNYSYITLVQDARLCYISYSHADHLRSAKVGSFLKNSTRVVGGSERIYYQLQTRRRY
jgi:hypothetical protein